jgi:MYND finger
MERIGRVTAASQKARVSKPQTFVKPPPPPPSSVNDILERIGTYSENVYAEANAHALPETSHTNVLQNEYMKKCAESLHDLECSKSLVDYFLKDLDPVFQAAIMKDLAVSKEDVAVFFSPATFGEKPIYETFRHGIERAVLTYTATIDKTKVSATLSEIQTAKGEGIENNVAAMIQTRMETFLNSLPTPHIEGRPGERSKSPRRRKSAQPPAPSAPPMDEETANLLKQPLEHNAYEKKVYAAAKKLIEAGIDATDDPETRQANLLQVTDSLVDKLKANGVEIDETRLTELFEQYGTTGYFEAEYWASSIIAFSLTPILVQNAAQYMVPTGIHAVTTQLELLKILPHVQGLQDLNSVMTKIFLSQTQTILTDLGKLATAMESAIKVTKSIDLSQYGTNTVAIVQTMLDKNISLDTVKDSVFTWLDTLKSLAVEAAKTNKSIVPTANDAFIELYVRLQGIVANSTTPVQLVDNVQAIYNRFNDIVTTVQGVSALETYAAIEMVYRDVNVLQTTIGAGSQQMVAQLNSLLAQTGMGLKDIVQLNMTNADNIFSQLNQFQLSIEAGGNATALLENIQRAWPTTGIFSTEDIIGSLPNETTNALRFKVMWEELINFGGSYFGPAVTFMKSPLLGVGMIRLALPNVNGILWSSPASVMAVYSFSILQTLTHCAWAWIIAEKVLSFSQYRVSLWRRSYLKILTQNIPGEETISKEREIWVENSFRNGEYDSLISTNLEIEARTNWFNPLHKMRFLKTVEIALGSGASALQFVSSSYFPILLCGAYGAALSWTSFGIASYLDRNGASETVPTALRVFEWTGAVAVAGYVGYRQVGFTNLLSKYNHFRASLYGAVDDNGKGIQWAGLAKTALVTTLSFGLWAFQQWGNTSTLVSWAAWGARSLVGTQIPLQICFSCNASNARYACETCLRQNAETVAYCGKECQSADWNRHSKLMHK